MTPDEADVSTNPPVFNFTIHAAVIDSLCHKRGVIPTKEIRAAVLLALVNDATPWFTSVVDHTLTEMEINN